MPRLPRSLLGLAALCAALIAPAGAAAFGPLETIGSFGKGAGQLGAPKGMDVAPDGGLYVAEYNNNRISVFSGAGVFQRAFGYDVNPNGAGVCTTECQAADGEDAKAGQMDRPTDVALDGENRVFIADSGAARVDVFTTAGEFRFAFGKDVGGPGVDICTSDCSAGPAFDEEAGAVRPSGIEVDGGHVFVANQLFNRVDVFTTAGAYLYSFGEGVNPNSGNVCDADSGCREGEANGPEAIGQPRDLTLGVDGRLYIADAHNERVVVWTREGEFVTTFGSGQVGEPVSIAATPSQILVANGGTNVVEVYGYAGANLDQFAVSPDVASVASACGGNVYVGEEDGSAQFARITRYGEPGAPLPPCAPVPVPAVPAAPMAKVDYLPSNLFAIGKPRRNLAKGTARLRVELPGPGRLVLRGPGVVKVVRTPAAAGGLTVAIRPKGKAKRRLRETGKATARGTLIFTPTGGTPRAEPRAFMLRRTLR